MLGRETGVVFVWVLDADEKWNEWKNMPMTFINKHAPVKKKRVGRKTSPWIT